MSRALASVRSNAVRVLSFAALLAAAVACAPEPTVTSVHVSGAGAVASPTILECPTNTTVQGSGLVTPLGGVVAAGGTVITVPAGAVLAPTTLVVTIPASNYMEVDISAQGASHFQFEMPVTITLSYARCSRSNIDKGPLSAWYINSATKALLTNMGASDDKSARTVTFTTDHLSGYAVAN